MGNTTNTYDHKLLYLAKTFSRTKRKDYENYSINRIWSLLNRTDIKPVTQSYVKFNDGNYALLDLHFPSINYAIEIDEAYHLTQREKDQLRYERIQEQFRTYRHDDLIIRRIDMTASLDNIHAQIDAIVEEINDIIEHSNYDDIKWTIKSDAERITEFQEQGIITVNDDVKFSLKEYVYELFYHDRPNIQMAHLILKNDPNYVMWFPEETINTPKNKDGWVNEFDESGEYITEYNINDRPIVDKYEDGMPRITFIKTRDPLIPSKIQYVFVGVFKLIDEDYGNTTKRTYKRISTLYNLNNINPYF